jgi:dihydroorotate dehydrogenase
VYKFLLKPLLFKLDPEKAHHLTIRLFNFALAFPGGKLIFKSLYHSKEKSLEREVFGLKFKNPVGLAAGFDKDGKYFKSMAHLGFGFIEIGTVTPKGQDGNPKPRLFRLPKDEALINRMGFNNEGVGALVERLKGYKRTNLIIGGNIGKNKVTPNEEATDDYVKCFEALFDYVDYFVVNVSSPNTPGLRELQEKQPLTKLLSTLQDLNDSKEKRKPLLLKIAPDLTDEQLDDIIEIAHDTKLDGIIASNTTISRKNLHTNGQYIEEIGNGGLSGQPVRNRSTQIIAYIHQKTKGKLPIIGVGGIQSPEDAKEKLDAGASLVQVYTGLIYEGPGMIREINKALL